MVIKRQLAHLTLLLSILAPTIPVVAAERALEMPEEVPAAAAQPAPRSDKDEKQEKAEKDGKEKVALAAIKKNPDHIPVESLEQLRRKDKEGNVIEEYVDSKDIDIFSATPFGEVIVSQLKEGKHFVIAQVRTTMPDGSHAVHYFDPEGLHKEIQAKGFINPNNRQPITHFSYFVYAPNDTSFKYMCSYKSGEWVYTLDHLQEWAEYTLVEALAETDSDARKKLTHLSDKATIEDVKHLSRLKLAELYNGREGDGKKAQQLYHSLIDAPGTIGAAVHARLAVGYFRGYGEWEQDRERALDHALAFINHSHLAFVRKDLCAYACCIAGELVLEQPDHKYARSALGLLEQVVTLAGETQLPKLKARAHACLAICYYNDPLFGEGIYSQEENGRYVKAWNHCIEALKEHKHVKHIHGFLDLVAEMRYFALGNDGDVKEALAYIEHYKKTHRAEKLPPILNIIINHRKYWHTKNKQEAMTALEKLVEDDDHNFQLKIHILLGEMYAHEAHYASEQAELHAVTDPVASLKYNNEAYARRNQAGVAITQASKYGKNPKRPPFEWALAALTQGRLELWRPAKSYAKAAHVFKKVCEYDKDFPLLASSACAELYELQYTEKIKGLDQSFVEGVHPKDPKYYDVCYKKARTCLQLSHIFSNEDHFNTIIKDLTLVSTQSPNVLLRMQARTHLDIAKKKAELSKKLDAAASEDYLEYFKQKGPWPAHDGEHKERVAAMMPLASAALALAAAAEPRSNKRKGEDLDRESSKAPKNDNGAGSGYVPAAELDKD